MRKKLFFGLAAGSLVLLAGPTVRAQSYSNAVMALNPAAYWPLQENVMPPFGAYVATNLGTAGAAGQGYYQTWFQPWNTGTNTLYYQTNNIKHGGGAIGDGDTALSCNRSTNGAGGYVVFPRTTNGVANPTVSIVPPFSLELWVNPTSTISAVMPIIVQGRVPTQGDANYGYTNWTGWCVGQFGSLFFFASYNGLGGDGTKQEIDTPSGALVANQWQHLVLTFNGTNQTWFKNGVQLKTRAIPSSAANSLGQLFVPDPTSPLLIGTGSVLGSGNNGTEYAGYIDEVAIYPRILDSGTIANHYAAAISTDSTYKNTVVADNPAIYVRLGEPPFPSSNYPNPSTYPVASNYGVIGAAGNGYYQPGTVPGVAGPTNIGFGATSLAVALNGFSGAVDIGAGNLPPELNPTNKAPLTVAGWFRANPADAPARFQEMVGHGNSSWRLAMDNLTAGPRFNPGNGPELQFANSADLWTNGFAINDGQWHFVAGVSDGTNDNLYVDGILARSGTSVGAIAGSTLDALLGGDPGFLVPIYNGSGSSQPRYFNGQLAHVSFFTNALSTPQIQTLYSAAGVAPLFYLQPVSQTNNANTNITLYAGAHGSLPLSYQWYQDGAPLSNRTNANLIYNPSVTNNSGSYFVVVTNDYGSVTSSIVALTVLGVPVIQQQSLGDVRVFASTSPRLHVTASGAQPISYQWSSNGVALVSGTNASYTISNVQASATYTCTVTNLLGPSLTSVSPMTVTVVSAPTAPYPVAVLGSGPAAYYRLDESPDDGSGNNGVTAYDNAGGYNAIYNNVMLAQPGYNPASAPDDYAVLFGNIGNNNDYAGRVPTYLNFGVPKGGNAQFSVEAWLQEYGFVNAGNSIVALGYGNGGEQFVLDTGASGGALRFFVRNASGTVSAATSTFFPANDAAWHHVVGVCDQAGGKVYLYLDGTLNVSGNITAGSGLLSSTMPMTIGARQSANSDPANYDFQFIGNIDEVAVYSRALSAAEVQNHYLAAGIGPVITAFSPVLFTTNQGASVTFTATAVGTAPLSYQWYDPANNPIGQNTNKLTLASVQTSQSGTYTLSVMNTYGTATTNASLTIEAGAPQLVTDLTPAFVKVYVGDPVTLSWQVSGSQPVSYQWFLNDSVITDAPTNGSYSFPALLGTNTYSSVVTNSYSFDAGGPLSSSTAAVIGVAVPTVNPDNFNYKAKLTFTGYNRSETLKDFPVLVDLGTNLSGFAYSQLASPTGGDLRFADASGTRALPFEIDEWNDTNGTSTIWVQVPRLSSNTNYIWVYWGNPGDTTLPDYATNGLVWVPVQFENLPAFQVVYHLKESALPFADAALQHTATNGIAPMPTAGMIGTAGAFGGTAWLDAGTNDVGDAFTLSSWVNIPTGTTNIDTLWANAPGGFGKAGFALFVNTFQHNDQVIDFASGNGAGGLNNGNESTTSAGTVPFGSWHLVSVAVNRTNGTAGFYLDGTNVFSSTRVVTNFTTLNDLRLGQFADGAFDFRGAMDEARVQSGVNSSNWVWASWATVAQNSTFGTYSDFSSSLVTLSYQVSGNELLLSWPSGALLQAPTVNGPWTTNSLTSPVTNIMTGEQQYYRVQVR